MGTPKQRKAAIKVSENIRKDKPETLGAVLRASGYSESVSKRPSQVTHSEGFKSELEPMLKRHNVTKEQYVKNIGEAMTANRVAQIAGDFFQTDIPDHGMRLAANKQAKDLLNFTEEEISQNPDLAKALSGGVDEIELQRLIFKKT